MDKLMDAVKAMPKMLAGNELASALTILPEYDGSIRNESEAVRLMALYAFSISENAKWGLKT